MDSTKLNQISDIWQLKRSVICLYMLYNMMPMETSTRKAVIIDVLGVQNLTNLMRDYYGKTKAWSRKHRGILLMHKAMRVFLESSCCKVNHLNCFVI